MPQHKPRNPACTIAHILCPVSVSSDRTTYRTAPNRLNRIHRIKNSICCCCILELTSLQIFLFQELWCMHINALPVLAGALNCHHLLNKISKVSLHTCLKSLQKGIFSSPSFLSAGCLNLHRSPLKFNFCKLVDYMLNAHSQPINCGTGVSIISKN